MSPLFRKKASVLDKRLKKIRKELSMVDSDILSLSKTVEKPERSAEPARPRSTERGDGVEAVRGSLSKVTEKEKAMMRDKWFISYLMSSGFQTGRPLRHERRIQRNKAIVMCFFALLVLFWVLFRFFF